jgi:hypothetical protein
LAGGKEKSERKSHLAGGKEKPKVDYRMELDVIGGRNSCHESQLEPFIKMSSSPREQLLIII